MVMDHATLGHVIKYTERCLVCIRHLVRVSSDAKRVEDGIKEINAEIFRHIVTIASGYICFLMLRILCVHVNTVVAQNSSEHKYTIRLHLGYGSIP